VSTNSTHSRLVSSGQIKQGEREKGLPDVGPSFSGILGRARAGPTAEPRTPVGDVAKCVKFYREALAPIPCGRVAPYSCLGDSLSPESDGPCLLRRGRASSVSEQPGACLNIT
jgi:hypothetical protein